MLEIPQKLREQLKLGQPAKIVQETIQQALREQLKRFWPVVEAHGQAKERFKVAIHVRKGTHTLYLQPWQELPPADQHIRIIAQEFKPIAEAAFELGLRLPVPQGDQA